MSQPWLFQPLPRGQGDRTIQERFADFHELNPWVYGELKRMANQMHQLGRTHLGIKMFIEVIRWNYYRQTIDRNSVFKLNNDYTSRYVRMLVAEEPHLEPLFETRRLRAA